MLFISFLFVLDTLIGKIYHVSSVAPYPKLCHLSPKKRPTLSPSARKDANLITTTPKNPVTIYTQYPQKATPCRLFY